MVSHSVQQKQAATRARAHTLLKGGKVKLHPICVPLRTNERTTGAKHFVTATHRCHCMRMFSKGRADLQTQQKTKEYRQLTHKSKKMGVNPHANAMTNVLVVSKKGDANKDPTLPLKADADADTGEEAELAEYDAATAEEDDDSKEDEEEEEDDDEDSDDEDGGSLAS